MKKIISVGIIAILLASIFAGLVLSSVASPDDWVINGNTVEREDANVYMGATPHTISSGGLVYFDLISKTYTGDIDVVWGFDVPNVKPSKPELYSPHWNNWTIQHSQLFQNVSSFSVSSDACNFGNSYNSLHYNVTYETCDAWNESTFECEGYKTVSSVVCFDSQTNDGTNYTARWHTDHSKLILWKDISGLFTKVNYDYGGMNTWYYVKNVPVVAEHSYQVRAWVDVPITNEGVNGKYWWAVKPSSETISQAIANGHFYALDPWYSSSWAKRKQWTITNVNVTTLTNFVAYINVSDEPEMQADWDDVVFTDSNSVLIPYELENYTTGFGDCGVNVTIPGSSSVSGWVYYGNDGASSQENPEGVYDSHTKMVHHMQNLNDSTSNDNDATNHGATYTSSGQVDGAYDYNGSSDYWDCGNDASLNITDAITIEAWVKAPDISQNNYAFQKDDGTLNRVWGVKVENSKIRFIVWDSNGVLKDVYSDVGEISNNTWFHVVAIRDGSIPIQKMYVDNILQTITDSWSGTIKSAPTISVEIGRFSYFNGTIDEVRIYNRALSADEINQSYQLVTNQSTFVTWGSSQINEVWDICGWNNATQAYVCWSDDPMFVVNPNEGFVVYANTSSTWDGEI